MLEIIQSFINFLLFFLQDASAKLSGKATPPYKHCILDGNESNMMREVFATRPWWSPADKPQSNNLWWGSNGQKIPSWPEKGASHPSIMDGVVAFGRNV